MYNQQQFYEQKSKRQNYCHEKNSGSPGGGGQDTNIVKSANTKTAAFDK